MADFDLIIFDCDGTLTDSEYVNNRALLETLHEAGFAQYDLDHAYQHWVGKTVTNICLAIQMETGRAVPADLIVRYIDRVAELQKLSLKPIEGAPDLVSAAAQKYRICVASNGERTNVIRSLEMTGIMRYLSDDIVFSKTQVKNPKPASDLFLYAATQMGVEPNRCLVIEDSAAGVTAGVAAGMTTWGFTGSAHDPEKQAITLKFAGASDVFARLIHIAERLGL
jgi:HAD superfamily hydrolase (TIGR01509 family)